MAHSRTYREIVKSFERFASLPGGLRRAIAALITVPVLGGMFFASSVFLTIPLGIVYAGYKGDLGNGFMIVGVFATLLVIAAMLVLTILGTVRFCQSRELEDIAFSLGLAFWLSAAMLFLCIVVLRAPAPAPSP